MKPRIKKFKGAWQCSGKSHVGRLATELIAYGWTKEEAYEKWYREWVRASMVYVPIDSVFFNR